jgi:hypothetical protein
VKAGPDEALMPCFANLMCMDNEKRWWYSLTRHTVEDDDGPTPGKDRLGPFPTPEAAARALETVQRRNEEWDAQD